jgi:hypothetical protein
MGFVRTLVKKTLFDAKPYPPVLVELIFFP